VYELGWYRVPLLVTGKSNWHDIKKHMVSAMHFLSLYGCLDDMGSLVNFWFLLAGA